jgi:hypothetical protein
MTRPRALLAAPVALVLLVAGCSAQTPPQPSASPAPPGVAAPAQTAVLTQKGDPTRTGWNATETVLTQATVDAAHFGRRTTYSVDGAVYAQPLFLPGLTVGNGVHNTVFVATEHDSVYAFDADVTGAAAAPLWHRSLLPSGAKPLSAKQDVTCAAISPEVGITGTPVIDPATGTLYVVATFRAGDDIRFELHALDVRSGRDTVPAVRIEATEHGTARDAVNGTLSFVPRYEQQRMGLLLLNGTVYVAFASYCDEDPSHGWILGYRGTDLRRTVVYTDSPDAGTTGNRPGGGGLWESETGLTADAAGSIYAVTGNGPFNLDSGGRNAGNSLVRLVPDGGTLRVADWFSPFHQFCLNNHDQDLGSGGPLLLPKQNEVLFIGKGGRIYVSRLDHLGGQAHVDNPCAPDTMERTDLDAIVQELPDDTVQGGVWGSETTWSGYVYTAGIDDHLTAWRMVGGKVVTPAASRAPQKLSYPGGIPVGSSNGDVPGTGILWIVSNEDAGPALHAYDPANLAHELYNSGQDAKRDGLSGYCNFTVPTVTAGRVFVGTRGSLVVYGPLGGPGAPGPPSASVTG